MVCYFPLQGYRAKSVNESGKRSVVFSRKAGFIDLPVVLPCGRCVGCRLERSRQWAIRCVHEASLYSDNCFITLTYSDDHLPKDGSLHVDHFQKFMKRLRFRCQGFTAVGDQFPIRFFHCGEYGEKFGRPHFHAILFNYDFPDKVLWTIRNGQNLYRSKILEELWPFGHSSVGSATFESAAYVARYIMKKQTGDLAFYHYSDIDFDTGEVLNTRKPEYTTMSRKPGIGKAWFDRWSSDVFPSDEIIFRGKRMSVPRYYGDQYELISPDNYVTIKFKRKKKAKLLAKDNTPDRLAVKLKCKLAKVEQLVRNYE